MTIVKYFSIATAMLLFGRIALSKKCSKFQKVANKLLPRNAVSTNYCHSSSHQFGYSSDILGCKFTTSYNSPIDKWFENFCLNFFYRDGAKRIFMKNYKSQNSQMHDVFRNSYSIPSSRNILGDSDMNLISLKSPKADTISLNTFLDKTIESIVFEKESRIK